MAQLDDAGKNNASDLKKSTSEHCCEFHRQLLNGAKKASLH
jgi:hypothetical protein